MTISSIESGNIYFFIPLVKHCVTKYQQSRKLGPLAVDVLTDEVVKLLFSKQDTG